MKHSINMLENGKTRYQIKKEQNEQLKLKLYNRPYTFFKSDYKPIMPLTIYQTWYTKDLPTKMRERVEILKKQNPIFNHHLFEYNECR